MTGNRSRIGAALVALALLPGAVWAAGQITGVVANPNPAYVNQPVTVTVQGVNDRDGTCSQVVVRCKAPAAPEHVQTNIALPFNVACSYGAAGIYTVTASPEFVNPDCPGDKIIQVTVKSKSQVGIGPAIPTGPAGPAGPPTAHFLPKIESFVPFSNPTPGGAVAVGGKGFGSQPGQLQIVGQFGTRNLMHLDWGSNGKIVAGTLPYDICDVPDHAAKLVVVTKDGYKSNEWPVTFLAGKEVRWLSWQEIQVVSCGQDGNIDYCNNNKSHDWDCAAWDEYVDDGVPGAQWTDDSSGQPAIAGFHYNCWGALSSDSGTDSYQLPALKNGWKLFHAGAWTHASEGSISGPTPAMVSEATSWAPSFAWTTTADDYVAYKMSIGIEGPCGLPHK